MSAMTRVGATLAMAASLAVLAAAPGVSKDTALDRAAAALGGADALGKLTGFVVEASGTRATPDEGPVPGGPTTDLMLPYTSTITVDVPGSRIRREHQYTNPLSGEPRAVTEIVNDDGGFLTGQDWNILPPADAPLLPDRVVSIRTRERLTNPQLLVAAALTDPGSVTEVGDVQLDGVTYQGLQVPLGDSPVTLLLDPTSGAIVAATRLESDPLRRDVELVVRYADWADTSSGVSFPGTIDLTYDGVAIQHETRTVSTDSAVDDAAFEAPAGIVPAPGDEALARLGDLRHSYLQSFAGLGFPLDGPKTTVTATELAPGIYHVTGAVHHSLAVVQDDGVVIIDAPYDESRTQAILDWLPTVTDLPVTHVVLSHHHADHSGGLRSMAGTTGAVAVVGAPDFFEQEVFSAPSELIPDGIDGSTIETMSVPDAGLTLDSATNPVRVLRFPNPHAEDYLLVQAGPVLWVVDIYSPQTGAPVPDFLAAAVTGMGLDPTIVAGGHGGFEPWPATTATPGPS